jgi:hypothetical protein
MRKCRLNVAVVFPLAGIVAILLIVNSASCDATTASESEGSLPQSVSGFPNEQLALLRSLLKSGGPEAKKLLAELGIPREPGRSGKSLLWWGTMPGIGTPPVRVYLFDMWIRSCPPPKSPIVCVVTDEERHLLSWQALADGGLGLSSVETFVYESPAALAVRVRTRLGVLMYRYCISRKDVRQQSVTLVESSIKHLGGSGK